MSSPSWFIQQVHVISFYPLPIAQQLLLVWVDISYIQIWDWLVQFAYLQILAAYHHQAAVLTLGNFSPHFLFFDCVSSLDLATCDRLQLALYPTCLTPRIFSIKEHRLFWYILFILFKNHQTFPGEKCLLSMNRCFWKHPDDVISRIKTRSARKNEPSLGWRVITKYYGDKQKRRESNEFW